ncbi:MAG: CDP-diacylglycerol--serine O-phosphatidyltransferase [Chthoniobacterales bacterium]
MSDNENYPRIYLLPNLMTAGNLFCGFAAVLRIFEATLPNADVIGLYHHAVIFILGAFVFDMLDGRLARLGGQESPFGREFDSIADVISFGIAPALLVYKIVLIDFHRWGWLMAFFYLLCGAMRLARFNCIAQQNSESTTKDFEGFPIPAAAGLIASLTMFLLSMQEGERQIGNWKYALPVLIIFLSFMMFSRVRYPSFKGVNWRTQRSIPRFLLIIVLLLISAINYQWMPALLFVLFLIYGFVRPFISMALRREIEEEEEDIDSFKSENGEDIKSETPAPKL